MKPTATLAATLAILLAGCEFQPRATSRMPI